LVPAILCGNSVLLKDNPRTPLSNHNSNNSVIVGTHFEKACDGTDLALRFFADPMCVKQLFKAHEISYVVFMGSLENARDVYEDVAENDFIDVQLDLGGKDGAYVAPDCDFDLTLQTLVKGAYYNTGQSRNSIQRIFVHKEISTKFINAFSKKVFEDLKMGDPMNEDTYIGPMAVLEHVEQLMEICEDAINMGGQVVIGGNPNTDEKGLGRFFEPTVIVDANNGMRA
jgi:acyl-CoA reductase-like NAD-dependent aldehyde dehydrogenase